MDKKRIAKAHTPLGPTLMFRQLTGHEDISQLFDLQLELLANKDASVKPSALLGKDITIELEIQGGGTRFLNGQVTRFAFVGKEAAKDSDLWRYEARLRPWLWYLTRSSDCKIWQNKTVPDILDEVFGKYPFPVTKKLEGSYKEWEYCVQYQETDFNFVSRLMEHEGIYYYFEHEKGRHTLVLADAYGAHSPVPSYATIPYIPQDRVAVADEECIDTWQVAQDVEPGAFYTDDYDFKKPSAQLDQPRKKPFDHPHGAYEIYDWPGTYTETGDGENYARVRLEGLQAPHETVVGQSNVRGIAPGYLFTLKKCPRADQNREYLILSANYYVFDNPYHTGGEGEGAQWRLAVTAQPSSIPFRAPRSTPKPLTSGPQTAVVVGPSGEEIWCDEYGRVKVQFHWDRYGKHDDHSSCWIRVSQPWAGSNWGGIFTPRIGQEVIVDFICGDPDQPIITGRVYNAEQMPPWTLPDDKTQSGVLTRSSQNGSTDDANMLRFEDKKGEEEIHVHAQKQLTTVVEQDELRTVGGTQDILVKKKKTETVKADNDLHIEGDLKKMVDGMLSLTVAGDQHEKVGMNHALESGMEIHLKAGMKVIIEAGLQLTIKASGGFVDIGPAGVTIQGTMVLINSGGAAGTGSGSSPSSPEDAKEAE
jgi:type VI secretion system secreted protein VgrG